MNKKILLVIALIAGMASAYMVQQHVASLTGESITVFKATDDAGVGEVLGGSIEAVTLPANLFPDALKEALTAEFQSYIEKTPLRLAVKAGDLLLYRHFDSSVDPGVLPSIPPGKKALSIPVNQASSVTYFIRPGDLVDVMGTFADAESRLPGQEGERISTRPVLQAVEVLATGDEYRASEIQSKQPYGTVTLLVSMEEAAKLIFAKDFYGVDFTLMLRSEEDLELPDTLPRVGVGTDNFDDIGNKKPSDAESE